MSSKEENPIWANLIFKLALNTASHPFEYAKVLIQIGHEPLAPYVTKTLLTRKPVLGLPNVLDYVKYIKHLDGYSGCYRGLAPRLLGNSVNLITYRTVSDAIREISPPKRDKKLALLRDILIEIGGKTAAIIVSHPFQVITIRAMAQFVGRETQYNGIFSSIIQIYKNDGILGFFAGLIPRLLGEIFLTLIINISLFTIKYTINDTEFTKCSSIFVTSVTGTGFTYPFQVVSTCMAVNSCGLSAGNPPQMPVYNNWIECWRHLKRTDQLCRGSSMFFRYYFGPHVSSAGYHNVLVKNE